jgi:predicted amidophosphoribosyltransferase
MGGNAVLARLMADFVHDLRRDVDMLIPVLPGKKRLKEPGYNQVNLIARPRASEPGLQDAPHGLWMSRETVRRFG